MKKLDSQKHLFSLPKNVHYLNCANKAPLLKSSEQAGIQALYRERNPIDSQNLKYWLDKNRGYLSLRGEYLRVSVNVFNDGNDINKLIETIEQTVKK